MIDVASPLSIENLKITALLTQFISINDKQLNGPL